MEEKRESNDRISFPDRVGGDIIFAMPMRMHKHHHAEKARGKENRPFHRLFVLFSPFFQSAKHRLENDGRLTAERRGGGGEAGQII